MYACHAASVAYMVVWTKYVEVSNNVEKAYFGCHLKL